MKLKKILCITALASVLTIISACGKSADIENDVQTESSAFTGTVEEKKDFMLIVADNQNNAYPFTFDDEDDLDLDDIQVGDEVKVTYTGEVSMVDPFTGKVISVEKIK